MTLDFELLPYNDPNIPLIKLQGTVVKELPSDNTNLIYKIFSDIWQNDLSMLERLRITIDSDIPIAKGLGSSAAATVAAIFAAHKLAERQISEDEILYMASVYEGHSENACSSLFGGLVVCAPSKNNKQILSRRLDWPKEWKLILTVPDRGLLTKESRAVIPQYIQYQDAVHNIQRVAMFLTADSNKDAELMKEALHDRLHEPYRAHLVPELKKIPEVLAKINTIGTILSGAGSSVLTIVHEHHHQSALRTLTAWASNECDISQILDLTVDHEGIKMVYK